jgi:hypothetical protein
MPLRYALWAAIGTFFSQSPTNNPHTIQRRVLAGFDRFEFQGGRILLDDLRNGALNYRVESGTEP